MLTVSLRTGLRNDVDYAPQPGPDTVSWNAVLFLLNNKFPAYLSFSRKETDLSRTVPDNQEWSGSGNKFTQRYLCHFRGNIL